MNRKNSKQRKMKRDEKPKNIIRCNFFQLVVWEHEVCTRFDIKDDSLNQKNCKNCKYAF